MPLDYSDFQADEVFISDVQGERYFPRQIVAQAGTYFIYHIFNLSTGEYLTTNECPVYDFIKWATRFATPDEVKKLQLKEAELAYLKLKAVLWDICRSAQSDRNLVDEVCLRGLFDIKDLKKDLDPGGKPSPYLDW